MSLKAQYSRLDPGCILPASQEVLMEEVAEAWPRRTARIAGMCYLLTFVTGGFAAFASRRLAMYGDAANLLATACYVAVILLFYKLFKPVNKSVSLLAAFVGLVACGYGVLSMYHLAPFQINTLVSFGVYCLLIGYLIFRSTFLPRFLGVLMAFAGLGWLSFASPRLAHDLSPYNMAPGIVGEGALTLWLLVVGMNVQRWKEQASAAGARRT